MKEVLRRALKYFTLRAAERRSMHRLLNDHMDVLEGMGYNDLYPLARDEIVRVIPVRDKAGNNFEFEEQYFLDNDGTIQILVAIDKADAAAFFCAVSRNTFLHKPHLPNVLPISKKSTKK